MKRWSKTEDQKLTKLYLKENLSFRRICEILSRSPAAISNRVRILKIRRKNQSSSKLLKVTPALARIHAHVCGDGYLTHYREKDDYGLFIERINTIEYGT